MRRLFVVIATIVVGAVWWRRRRLRAHRAAAPADVHFMYAMHNAFRRDLTRLERTVVGTNSLPPGWVVFREELEFHHRAEDDDLWPELRARTNDANDLSVIDSMIDEHAQVAPALDAVARALDRRSDLESAFDALATLVRTHLDHEEQLALPLIEHQLSDADWHDYLRTQRRKRGRKGAQFLCWVLDDATTGDATTVLREVRPPGRFVYRYFLKPRYDARHLWPSEGDNAAQLAEQLQS